MSILEPRGYYKPFAYDWAYKLWLEHEAMHWSAREVPLQEDVRDWNTKLKEPEKSLLTHLFRFFTQADISVAGGYNRLYLPYFSHKPELAMMMNSFAAREAVHVDAYATLLETVGMPETTYSEFQSYKEMVDKANFVEQFDMSNPFEALKSIAVYSAFAEGMQLFASFVVLLNFSRFNKMKNMGTIISWSLRDENCHVEGMTKLFKVMKKDVCTGNKGMKNELMLEVMKIAYQMVDLEDHFIDLCFSGNVSMEGLTPDEVKLYIRYITNKRWKQLGYKEALFDIANEKNPLPWVDYMVNGEEHGNFFETKPTFYSKASTKGTMDDIKWV